MDTEKGIMIFTLPLNKKLFQFEVHLYVKIPTPRCFQQMNAYKNLHQETTRVY